MIETTHVHHEAETVTREDWRQPWVWGFRMSRNSKRRRLPNKAIPRVAKIDAMSRYCSPVAPPTGRLVGGATRLQ